MSRALIDRSEADLKVALRETAEHVSYAYNDVRAELDRRAAERQARASFILSVVGLVVAVTALVVTALKT